MTGWGQAGPPEVASPPAAFLTPQAHAPARAAQPILPKPGTGDRLRVTATIQTQGRLVLKHQNQHPC